MTANYEQLSRFTYITVLVAYAALLVLYVLTLLMYPSCGRSANLVIAGLHLVPLMCFLPSLMRHNLNSYVWLCFLCLAYFLGAVQNALACTTVLNVTEPLLLVVLFCSAMMYVRWRARALRARQESKE